MEYGLIGEHLSHSYSKQIHASIADYDYILKEITPEALQKFMEDRQFKGINVTIPYKERVIGMLDEVDETARHIGAVNTVVNINGKLRGSNTDAPGLMALIMKNKIDLEGKKVLILGTGGTSKTAVHVAQTLGASEVLRVSRTEKPGCITYEEAESLHSDAGVIINTTPVGMFPDEDKAPVDLSAFHKLSGVVDVIFHPFRTNLILQAEALHIPACGGLYMLAAQAVFASSLFLQKTETDSSLIDKAYNNVLTSLRNVVLIGMPSCGKSTIGKILSQKTVLKQVDTDNIITERIGMTIEEFFKKNGEKAFRDIESEVISEVSRQNGIIISTGGGAVLREENVRALKRNGIVFFLDRSLERLKTTDSRPLSSDREKLNELYKNRYDIYTASADAIIDGDLGKTDIVDIITAMIREA
ncbi:MAG: shikimate dehydrogenase [Lachnospiraceae bacterium]|nr:shikimate dehydrogenase [Lachnospiraceae bacterium]